MRKLIEILRTLYRKLRSRKNIDVNQRAKEAVNIDRCESSE